MAEPGRGPAIADFRSDLHAWLDMHQAELTPPFAEPGTLDDQIVQIGAWRIGGEVALHRESCGFTILLQHLGDEVGSRDVPVFD